MPTEPPPLRRSLRERRCSVKHSEYYGSATETGSHSKSSPSSRRRASSTTTTGSAGPPRLTPLYDSPPLLDIKPIVCLLPPTLSDSRGPTSGSSSASSQQPLEICTSPKMPLLLPPPPPRPPPRDRKCEIVHATYKKIRRALREEKSVQVKIRWAQNREQLDRDLQSHKSFSHLHNAARLIRRSSSTSGGPEATKPKVKNHIKHFPTPSTTGSGPHEMVGPVVSVTLFTSPKGQIPPFKPPPAETTPGKQRGRGRPRRKVVSTPATASSTPPEIVLSLTQKVHAATLPWVQRIPPVVSWTAIPFNVAEEDGKFLTNIPFLGDEIIDKDSKFIDDMLNLYQGNLHDLTNRSTTTASLVSPPLPTTVSTSSAPPSTPSRLDDHILLLLVQELEQIPKFATNLSQPSPLIFTAIAATLPGNGTGPDLAARYKAILAKNIVAARNMGSPPPAPREQDPATYAIPNIDGPHAKDLPREGSMHAFQYLFCRRCYQYDCPRGHNGDDHIDLNTRRPQSSTTPSQFFCQNPTCFRIKSEFPPPPEVAEEVVWTAGEKSLFRAILPSFPDPCYIAHLLLTKTCAQVATFVSIHTPQTTTPLPPPPPLQPPPLPPPPPPPPTSATMKKRSKKSGSSISKKNLSRRWINSVRMRTTNSATGSVPLPARFMPCAHRHDDADTNGTSCCTEKNPACYCAKNGTSCEKFCSCPPTCKIRFPGCRCTSTCDSRRCVCFVAARECDPDLCSGCGANELDPNKVSCRNVNIQKRLHKHLLMGPSDIAGWGIFIKEDAQRGEFIAEYRGEIISHDESERRGHFYDKIRHTFLFELNDHFVVDAMRKGNKARFINSSKTPNCEVKRMLCNGDHRIGIYAKRFIDAGEELFYDYEDVLEKQQRVAATASLRSGPVAASSSTTPSSCPLPPPPPLGGTSSKKY